jgi:hypothetical protein
MKRIALVLLLILAAASPAPAFVRGDYDGAGAVDIADAVSILALLFQPAAPPPACADAADVNDDGGIDIADAIHLLNALFVPGSPPVPPPYPQDGIDPTPDSLPPCGPTGLLPFTTIAQGRESLADEFLRTVLLDDASWAAFWATHSADPLPPIDFASEMVVVVLGTFQNFGITYTIDEIEVIGSALEVRYTAVYPGVYLPEPCQPHHIVQTVRALEPPVFIEDGVFLP